MRQNNWDFWSAHQKQVTHQLVFSITQGASCCTSKTIIWSSTEPLRTRPLSSLSKTDVWAEKIHLEANCRLIHLGEREEPKSKIFKATLLHTLFKFTFWNVQTASKLKKPDDPHDPLEGQTHKLYYWIASIFSSDESKLLFLWLFHCYFVQLQPTLSALCC